IWNKFNESGGKELHGFKKKKKKKKKKKNVKHDNRGRLPILFEEHIQFLIKYIESNAVSTVDLAHNELCKAFPGLRISVNAVYKHMRTKCNLYLRRAEVLREERDPDTTI
ncbi:uncharacterized protein BX663DRAFT_569045, partial [Cokeromyces recurvatus]|uniref:uncharacterized protein n=1 Tax=Cokeromyces recurvatus TaxID=90255 RepID=UPI00221FC3A8